MLTRTVLTFAFLLCGIPALGLSDIVDGVQFEKIYSRKFSGIVVGSEDTPKRAIGNLLKITGKTCMGGKCTPCKRMTKYIGLNVGRISPGGKYNAKVAREFISENKTEEQSELLFRIQHGIAGKIGWVGYNDEFGFCEITLEIGNSNGATGCDQTPDCSLELGVSNKCVARRFDDVESPMLEISDESAAQESTCLRVSRLKSKICNGSKLNNVEEYFFACK